MSDNHLSDLTFSALDLAPALMQGIEEAGFTRCTPIQAQTLPFALAGRDIAVTVTSVLQNSAGRMIFGKLAYRPGEQPPA